MKVTFLLLLVGIYFLQCTAKRENNDDLKKSKIDSATIIDSIKKSIQTVSTNSWMRGNYVDEFGDSTKEKFVYSYAIGNFSNSATQDSPLFVQLKFDKDAAGIFLHEYGMDHPAQKFVGSVSIKMKNSEGLEFKIHSSSSWNHDGGILIKDMIFETGGGIYDYSNFKNFLLKNQKDIKFLIQDDYSSSYRFKIDMTGFNEALNSLKRSVH